MKQGKLTQEVALDPFVTDFYSQVHDLSIRVESPLSTPTEPYFYVPLDDKWHISHKGNLNFVQRVGMSPGFIKRLKFCFNSQVGVYSEELLRGCLFSFKKLDFEYDSQDDSFQINVQSVQAYIAKLRGDAKRHDNTKNRIHNSLINIANWSYQALKSEDRLFTEEAFRLLKKAKFYSVNTPAHDDPEKGRFDHASSAVLGEKIRGSYNSGMESALTKEEFILLTLLFIFGIRPMQFSHLKVGDLKIENNETGRSYKLSVPFLKQRKGSYRTRFEAFELESGLGRLIESIASGRAPDEGLFQFKDSPAHAGPKKIARGSLKGHVSEVYIIDLVSGMRERLNVPFATNAKRFRSFVGSKMYRELGPAHAGKILTHAQSASIKSYASQKVVADVVEGLVRKINCDSVDLLDITNSFLSNKETIEAVDAFEGLVVQKTHPQAPELRDLGVAERPNGACGSSTGACDKKGVGLPYVCYVCKHMRALSNGPHRDYLERTFELYLKLKEEEQHDQANIYLAPMFGMARVIHLIQEQPNV